MAVSLHKDYAPVFTTGVNLRKDSPIQQFQQDFYEMGRREFEKRSVNPMVLNPVPAEVYNSWNQEYKPLIPARLLPLAIEMAEIYAELNN